MRHLVCLLVLAVAGCAGGASFQRGVTDVRPYAPYVPQYAGAVDLSHCGGMGLVRYVGHPVVSPTEALPPSGGYVTWDDLPPDARILGAGTSGAGDAVPGRLTLTVDGQGNLHRLYCG